MNEQQNKSQHVQEVINLFFFMLHYVLMTLVVIMLYHIDMHLLDILQIFRSVR